MTYQKSAVLGVAASLLLGCNFGGGGGGGGAGGGAGGGSASSTITVTGVLVDNGGARVKNAPVGISGHWTTSDDSGRFTIANVTPPYDLMSVVSGTSSVGVIYKGLTRADPTILFLGLATSTSHHATVTGSLSGGDSLPAPADTTTVGLGASFDTVTANPFTLSAYPDSSPFTGTLRAIQTVKGPDGMPSAYKGYGERANVSVVDASTVTGQDITMTGVTTANLAGTVVLPTGATLSQRAIAAAFADGAALPLGSDTALGSAAFNFLTPASIGATISVRIEADLGDALGYVLVNGLAPGASGVTLTVLAPPVATLPVDKGTGISLSTDFVWTRFAGGVHVVSFTPTGASAANAPSFYVITADTTTRLPDLGAQGLPLPAATTYRWNFFGVAPLANLDGFATEAVIGTLIDKLSQSASTLSYTETLTQRSFTTQ
jgi:hypothetical protein